MLKSILTMLGLVLSLSMAQSASAVPRVNMPYFGAEPVGEHASAIFWYGQVTPAQNYTDIRIGYNDEEVLIRAQIFDRRIFHSEQAAPNDDAALSQWDAVTLYLDQRSDGGAQPTTASHRITVQVNWPGREADYRSVAQGNGNGYSAINMPITSTTVWRGDGPNNDVDDRGWFADVHIPFASLGLARAPAQGTMWRIAMQTHDRDDNTSNIEHSAWPNTMDPLKPNTWATLHFGLPEPVVPAYRNSISQTLRQGLNGVGVSDASVGGGTTCADGYDYFAQFGAINHAGEEHANVQNQSDVADWPCFSKFYLSFPLASLPTQQIVVSATLTLNQFGNSGQGVPPEPISSLIQAMTVNEDWQETALTWNNAPLVQENISMARALPMAAPQASQPLSNQPVVWDVTRATQTAYANGAPLRLVLYSADEAQNSGKYFWTSDVADGLAELRPTLVVMLGQPVDLGGLALRTYLPILRRD